MSCAPKAAALSLNRAPYPRQRPPPRQTASQKRTSRPIAPGTDVLSRRAQSDKAQLKRERWPPSPDGRSLSEKSDFRDCLQYRPFRPPDAPPSFSMLGNILLTHDAPKRSPVGWRQSQPAERRPIRARLSDCLPRPPPSDISKPGNSRPCAALRARNRLFGGCGPFSPSFRRSRTCRNCRGSRSPR